METTAQFAISETGDESGRPYTGTFKVKTLLDRRDRFLADERRRTILGASGQDALVGLQEEAFVLGQLHVRVLEAPQWWRDSNSGLALEDGNIIIKLYELTVAEEVKRRDKMKEQASEAVKQISTPKGE